MQITMTGQDNKVTDVKVKATTTPAQAEKLAATLVSVGAKAVVIKY